MQHAKTKIKSGLNCLSSLQPELQDFNAGVLYFNLYFSTNCHLQLSNNSLKKVFDFKILMCSLYSNTL